MTISYRPAAGRDSEDRQFIVSTWSSSFKRSHSAGIVYTDDWATIMRPQIERILDRGGARTMIACDKKDQSYFYGWISGDVSEVTPIVFYVYVKEPFRRTGIARGLFSALGVDPQRYFVYVCRPAHDASHLLRKIPSARFNPLEVRYPKEARRRPL